MDGNRFDTLTKHLAESSSRRQVVKGLGGGIVAGLLALVGTGGIEAAKPCPKPRTSCGTGKDKVCVDLATDAANCGVCANACTAPANATATCVSGTCGFECTQGLTACGGACVDLVTDVTNCGTCGNACDDGNECTTNSCSLGSCEYPTNVGAACTVDGAAGECDASGICQPDDVICAAHGIGDPCPAGCVPNSPCPGCCGPGANGYCYWDCEYSCC